MKAMVKNVFALRLKEGASTITQQLSRNLYLGHNDRNVFDTVTRKIREFITAIQLERSFTKDEILEFYLNVVYFGRGAYGIQAASQVYFGKQPAELSLAEISTLIAMLKGPGYYDPTNHPDRAISAPEYRDLPDGEVRLHHRRGRQTEARNEQHPAPLGGGERRSRDRPSLRGICPPATFAEGGEIRIRHVP